MRLDLPLSSLVVRPADLLRASVPPLVERSTWAASLELVAVVVLFGLTYGAVMGTFGPEGARPLQMLYSALKVPLLLLVTFILALPSFFVLNTLMGVRDDFGRSVRALVATQAGLTIILASLAPLTALWYASTDHYRMAILFNGLMFAVASLSAQSLLRRFYRPLFDKNPRHRTLLRIWLVLYIFVGIQMGWVLRPFVGDPRQPTRFVREGAWGNAYEAVAKMIWEVVRPIVQ